MYRDGMSCYKVRVVLERGRCVQTRFVLVPRFFSTEQVGVPNVLCTAPQCWTLKLCKFSVFEVGSHQAQDEFRGGYGFSG